MKVEVQHVDERGIEEGRIQPSEICCGAGSIHEPPSTLGDYEEIFDPPVDGTCKLRQVAQAARDIQSELRVLSGGAE
jgi:hypothetical protein